MKVGMIGAGNIASSLARTIQEMGNVENYAVASRDIERAEAFAKAYGFRKAYGSYEELVQDENVELVYIATPHSHHYEHARLSIEHGKPVLCEKAFMANAKQAKEILDLAREKHVFITEAIWTRYMPSRKMIQEIIAGGEIGEVTMVTANLGYDIKDVPRITEPALAGGALLDVGIYPLTFISMVLGNDVKEITSSCVKFDTGVDAHNAIIMKYNNGKMAIAHSSALGSTEQSGIVYGTKGYLVAEHINNITNIKVYSSNRELVREIPVPKQITGYEYQLEASERAIAAGKIECEEISHVEILYMMELMDRIRAQWKMVYPFEKED